MSLSIAALHAIALILFHPVQQDTFVPETKDLMKLGASSNIIMYHLKNSGKLLIDSVDFQSKPHAQYALDYLEKSNYKANLERALGVIAEWPRGDYKERARKYFTALSRAYSSHISALGNVANAEYDAASKDMDATKKLLEGAIDDLTYLFTARGIPDWEDRIKKEVVLADSDNVVHKENCKVADGNLKASDDKMQSAMGAAYEKAAKEKGWTKRHTDRFLAWVKQRPGTRGQCPLVLPEYLKEAFIPKFIFSVYPVSAEEAKSLKKCPHCAK